MPGNAPSAKVQEAEPLGNALRKRGIRWPGRARQHKAARIGYGVGTTIPKTSVAKPNYQYEKRQRELEKKKKKAEKALKKAGAGHDAPAQGDETGATPSAPATPSEGDAASPPPSR